MDVSENKQETKPKPLPHRFQPGQSGNPGGRPKLDAELTTLCRAKTAIAVGALVEIVRTKKSPAAARVAAAQALLDRGWGKSAQTMEHTGPDGGAIEFIKRVIVDPQADDA